MYGIRVVLGMGKMSGSKRLCCGRHEWRLQDLLLRANVYFVGRLLITCVQGCSSTYWLESELDEDVKV